MLPVTILTGFLGGGKTTLLRRLLASPYGRRIGILMNERGVAGIDDVAPPQAGFVELAEGCVCCVDQPDLVAALEALAGRGDLDRIVLETSGLADPLPISWAVARPDLADKVVLEAVITVVDAENHERTRGVEEWVAQVQAADVVVLSKLDLVGSEAAARALQAVRDINAGARLLGSDEALLALAGAEAVFGGPGGLAGLTGAAGRRAGEAGAPPLARHGDFATVAFAGVHCFDADLLEDFVTDLPEEVFRAKGIARVDGADQARAGRGGDPAAGRWLAFQAVGARTRVELPATPPAHGQSRLAFFGRGIDRAALEARLLDCRAEHPRVSPEPD